MIVGNPNKDFFEQNPFLKFKEFFYNISDEHGNEASDICWALYLMEYPDSPLYNVPREKRIIEIQKNYFKGKPMPDIARWAKDFLAATMSKEYLLYKISYDKLEELTFNLQTKDLNDHKEWSQSVSLLEKLGKLWDSMEALKDRYEESKTKSQLRGGGAISPRESRNARS